MIECVIFDLSEVLIAGLAGIQIILSEELGVPQEQISRALLGELGYQLFIGKITEQVYLEGIIQKEGWETDVQRLKDLIRANFHKEVVGSLPILYSLESKVKLVLLSDHAHEWVVYIKTIHPFLKLFNHTFFSFDLKRTKEDPRTFMTVLEALSLPGDRCLFIDDYPKNVHVARSVGIPSIQFLDAAQLARDLAESLC